jgi:hypothetical protein
MYAGQTKRTQAIFVEGRTRRGCPGGILECTRVLRPWGYAIRTYMHVVERAAALLDNLVNSGKAAVRTRTSTVGMTWVY